MLRTLAAAAALAAFSWLAVPATAFAQEEVPPSPPPPPPTAVPIAQPPPAPVPGRMSHLRIYLGGAAANQQANGSGSAVALGIQGYTDIIPIVQSYWGAELLAVRLGTFTFPLVDGDLGLRLTPFPDWFIRPYLRANLGLSFLVILPVPSAGVAVGLALPIFNTVFLDMALGVRRAFNVFDATQSVDLGVFELSIGF